MQTCNLATRLIKQQRNHHSARVISRYSFLFHTLQQELRVLLASADMTDTAASNWVDDMERFCKKYMTVVAGLRLEYTQLSNPPTNLMHHAKRKRNLARYIAMISKRIHRLQSCLNNEKRRLLEEEQHNKTECTDKTPSSASEDSKTSDSAVVPDNNSLSFFDKFDNSSDSTETSDSEYQASSSDDSDTCTESLSCTSDSSSSTSNSETEEDSDATSDSASESADDISCSSDRAVRKRSTDIKSHTGKKGKRARLSDTSNCSATRNTKQPI